MIVQRYRLLFKATSSKAALENAAPTLDLRAAFLHFITNNGRGFGFPFPASPFRLRTQHDDDWFKRSSVMETPEVHVLNQIGWWFFDSLTFKKERLPERIRLSMFFALMRKAARDCKVPFKKLLWCLRQERGESTLRRHFHFLLAGLPSNAVSLRTGFSLKNAWEEFKGGMARVTVFDPALSGGCYLLKPDPIVADAGDAYESAKFGGGSCDLMIAQSVWRLVTARRLLQLTR